MSSGHVRNSHNSDVKRNQERALNQKLINYTFHLLTMTTIYQQLEIPEENKTTSITEREAEYIYDFLIKNEIKKTLEVGFAYGCSAAHIISATKNQHYAIDPYQELYSNLGIKNIEKLKLKKFLIFENDLSHNVLPDLLKKDVKVDFALIDGGHKFDDIFIDFYYIDLLLNNKGYVLLHDSWTRSTQYVVSWIKNNKQNYKIIKTPLKNLILLQKNGKDERNWYHFKGFCNMKSYFSHLLFNLRYKEK